MDFREVKEFISDTFKYLVVIVIVLFLVVYVVSLQQVVGPSMNSSFTDGDILILNKSYYKVFSVDRGDVIAFTYDESKYLIKRVIGLPGDYITATNGKVYINGKVLEEKYLDEGTKTYSFDLSKFGFTTIPKDMYFVMGDNRDNSMDSRTIGLIKKSDIIGKGIARIWPLDKFNIYW